MEYKLADDGTDFLNFEHTLFSMIKLKTSSIKSEIKTII